MQRIISIKIKRFHAIIRPSLGKGKSGNSRALPFAESLLRERKKVKLVLGAAIFDKKNNEIENVSIKNAKYFQEQVLNIS